MSEQTTVLETSLGIIRGLVTKGVFTDASMVAGSLVAIASFIQASGKDSSSSVQLLEKLVETKLITEASQINEVSGEIINGLQQAGANSPALVGTLNTMIDNGSINNFATFQQFLTSMAGALATIGNGTSPLASAAPVAAVQAPTAATSKKTSSKQAAKANVSQGNVEVIPPVAASVAQPAPVKEAVPEFAQEPSTGLAGIKTAKELGLKPAVPLRESVTPDYIVCLESGKKLKMMKRHLMTHYQMTPEQYRYRWGLPATYPMTAANYSKSKSKYAKHVGLGRSRARAEPVDA